MQSFFVQKKTLIIETTVLTLFLGGMFYLYAVMNGGEATTSQAAVNQQLLGQKFTLFIKAVSQDKISFKETDFLKSGLVRNLNNFTEDIGQTETRGRDDPFVPYAPTRSLR